MLTRIAARRRAVPRLLAVLLTLAALTVAALPGARADGPRGSSTPVPTPGSGTLPHGVTVSWPPTNRPAEMEAGQTAHSTFWVTNDSDRPLAVTIVPATAQPGDNGHLGVAAGADRRFPSIRFSPSRFTARPRTTTAVTESVAAPSDLPPGVYLLPALVKPRDPQGSGNVQIHRSIAALTTFQVPGAVDVALDASLTPGTAPNGTLQRKIPGLPTIVIGKSAAATLRVTSAASSGTYASYEITGTPLGIGSLTFEGHTPGAVADLRSDPELYFPGLHRDFAIAWKLGAVTLGKDVIAAQISFNPVPNRVESVTASMDVIAISPWWLLVVVIVLLLLVAGSARRTARLARQSRIAAGRRRAQVKPVDGGRRWVRSGFLLVGTVVLGALSAYWLLAALVVVGLVATVIVGLTLGESGARRVGLFHAASGIVLAAGATSSVISLVSSLSPAYALAALAACLLWVIAGWQLHATAAGRRSIAGA